MSQPWECQSAEAAVIQYRVSHDGFKRQFTKKTRQHKCEIWGLWLSKTAAPRTDLHEYSAGAVLLYQVGTLIPNLLFQPQFNSPTNMNNI